MALTKLSRLHVIGPGALLVLTLVLAPHGIAPMAAQASRATYIREGNVDVPMRDGVRLRADILRPPQGPSPTLVYRTPYGKHAALENYTIFIRAIERGYAVVVQDVRGRYASDGEFRPYANEGHDGYDTIEWASRQPWSNGRVGTFGLSYPGAVQWLAAAESPPHLQAMVPAMTFSTPHNFFYSGGVWDLSWLEWIWMNIAPDARHKAGLPNPPEPHAVASWPALRDRLLRTLPLDQVQELRDVAPYYYDWLHHPPDDPVLGFRGAAEQVRADACGGTQPLGMARRQLRAGRGDHELHRARDVAREGILRGRRFSSVPGHTASTPRPGPRLASGTSVAPRPSITTRSSSAGWIATFAATGRPARRRPCGTS